MVSIPKVSVITFVYADELNGRLETLAECLDSVANQQFEDYEHVIVDDGSPVDLSATLKNYPNTRLIRKEGSGILSDTATFNLGHQEARGKYCIYLPSDDVQLPRALEALASVLDENPDVGWVIGEAVYEYTNQAPVIWKPNKEKIANHLSEANYVNGCAVMWRKDKTLLKRLPPHYQGFCCDYGFWLQLNRLFGPPLMSDVQVVSYRQVGDSTRNKTRSNFIVSPRANDTRRYQYSKIARLENVKSTNLDFDFESQEVIEVNIDRMVMPKSFEKSFCKREYSELNDYLIQQNNQYASLVKKIGLADGKVSLSFKCLGWCEVVLCNSYSEKILIDLTATQTNKESWVWDYIPISKVRPEFVNDKLTNSELFYYLGVV